MGDLDATWRSMLAPQTLTPSQRTALGKKLGIDDGPFKEVFEGLTNPFLIGALIISHKFPVAVGDEVFKLSKKVSGMTSKFPLLGRIASKEALFRGTSVPGDLDEIYTNVWGFKKKYNLLYGQALEKFEKAVGRRPSEKEQILVGAWLDGLHKSTKGFGGKKGVVRMGSGETMAELPGVKALFPNLETRMSAPTRNLATDMRGALNEAWSEVFGDVTNRKKILTAIRRQKAAGFSDDFTDVVEEMIGNPKRIADYFPHRVLQSEDDFQRLIDLMTKSGSSKQFAKTAQKKITSWASPETMKRQFAMLPSGEELEKVKEYVDQGEVTKLSNIVKARILHQSRLAGVRPQMIEKLKGTTLPDMLENFPKYMSKGEAETMAGAIADHKPASYSLRVMPVLNSYTHTLAGTYAWTVKDGGTKMMRSLEEARVAAATGNPYAKARAEMLENTYIPISMGRTTFQQHVKAAMWEQSVTEIGAKMDNPKLRGILGDSLTDTLKGHLANSRGSYSLMGIQRKASSYFYLSTLGLNVGSSLTNTLQNVLSLGPAIGYVTATKGMGEALRKSHKYFALRLGPRQLGHLEAINASYVEFAKSGLSAGPITEEIIENTIQNAYGIASLPSKGVSLTEKISRAMMALFTASETANRLASFEAGLIHARRAKLSPESAIQFATKLTQQTQFVSGPTAGPYALLGAGPLAKQFLYFPARMLEFATSTAFTLGSEGKNVLGYNPGTAARMVAGSIIAMELGDMAGVDLRSRLLGSALPTFQEPGQGKLLGAFPVIPPFFQVVGSVGVGLATGEWGEALRSTPLLIPGGIQAFKVAGFIPPQVPGAEFGQGVAKAFERTYADYTQPAPDGRIAVYSGRGTFRGFYNGWDLMKYGMGIRGGDMDKEQQLLQTISQNKDRITQARRDFVDARFRNAGREAAAIASTFKQQFGFDLPVSSADMKAMQVRRSVTRLEQLIRTTPAGPARDMFIQAVQTTLGGSASELLGVDPTLLSQSRQSASAARFGQGGRGSGGAGHPRFDARTDLGPTDQVNPQTLGRQPGLTQRQPIP